jgi:hypothetical protein
MTEFKFVHFKNPLKRRLVGLFSDRVVLYLWIFANFRFRLRNFAIVERAENLRVCDLRTFATTQRSDYMYNFYSITEYEWYDHGWAKFSKNTLNLIRQYIHETFESRTNTDA